MKYILYRKCSYCDCDMGTKDAGSEKMHGKISHAVCRECYDKLCEKYPFMKGKYPND